MKNQNAQLESNFRTLEGLKSDLKDARKNPPASQGAGYKAAEDFMLRFFGTTVHRFELSCVDQLANAKPASEVIQ